LVHSANEFSRLREQHLNKGVNPAVWLWLGLTAARTGDRRSAERCFQRAKQLGHPKADQALEWLVSGS